MKSQFLVLSALLAFVLAGCSTIDSRIHEKAAVFNQLSPADQAKILQGIIAVGFTPDMVYMALGKPTEIRTRTEKGNQETLWVYSTYYDRYEGTVHAGYRRWVYFDPRIRAYRIYYEPVYGQVFSEQQETNFRITFQNGKVSAIEEAKT